MGYGDLGPRPDPPAESPVAAVDPASEPIGLDRRLLLEVYEHARECYPEECCGILTGPAGERPRAAHRCTNLQNRRHAAGESRLDARHAFWIDEGDLMRALRTAEQAGEHMLVIYHSHVDTGAYMSRADVEGALGPNDDPLWPGVAHLVVSVQGGSVREAAYFEWAADRSAFVGRRVIEGDG
jgi:proteasome lid subunit RPN8/RPN11